MCECVHAHVNLRACECVYTCKCVCASEHVCECVTVVCTYIMNV